MPMKRPPSPRAKALVEEEAVEEVEAGAVVGVVDVHVV